MHTVQLRLREIKGQTTGFGDTETPTNTAQPQRIGTNNTRTAPQASTVPSSFLLHSSGRGESSAPAPSTVGLHPRSRPGSPLTTAPHPGATGRGQRLGHPGEPFTRPRLRGRWGKRTKEKKEAATPRRPHRGAAAPRSPRGATGAAGLGAASRRAARPKVPPPHGGSILPRPAHRDAPSSRRCRRAGSVSSPPRQPGKGTGSARTAGTAPPGGRGAAKGSAARGCFRLRRGGGERVPTSPPAPGRGKRGADGSRRQDGGGRRSWRGGAPRTWQQVHAGGDGGEGARGGKDETSEAFPANGACCAAGGGHSQVRVAREGGDNAEEGRG